MIFIRTAIDAVLFIAINFRNGKYFPYPKGRKNFIFSFIFHG